MSALKSWRTKEEVLRDLAEATGTRVGDLDEGYLVVGERPPPKHVIEDDDDEVHLLFGGLVSRRHVQGDSSPDLEGITEMLRMVNNYNGEEKGNDNGLVNPADTTITISKVTELDPNVKEFVPKCAVDSSSSSDNLDHNSFNNNVGNINITKTGNIIDNNEKNIESTETNVNNVETDNFKMLTEKLKKQINDASISDSFENKKQKNVAIATLLKLYAKAPAGITQKTSDNSALKLMTPEDFQLNVCIPNERVLTTEQISSETQNTSSQGSSDNNSKVSTSSCSTPVLNRTPVPNPALSPEQKASIEKVNKWLEPLEEPAKKKTTTIFTSPISFKRKEKKAEKPPVPDVQINLKPNGIQQYKPSKYASDLSKQYLERTKAKKAKRNMWSDLDIILKEKDLEIKKKLEQQSLDNQGSKAH